MLRTPRSLPASSHRRRPSSPAQTRSRQPFQHPRENRHVPSSTSIRRRVRDSVECSAAPGHVQVQESPQAQRIRDPPRNPRLRRQTLEVADEQEPEIPPRTQTPAAQPRRVEHRAQPLHKGIESGLLQNPVQPFEKGMSRARRKVRCGHPRRRRLSRRRLLAHCHAAKSTPLRRLRSSRSIDFCQGLLGERLHVFRRVPGEQRGTSRQRNEHRDRATPGNEPGSG